MFLDENACTLSFSRSNLLEILHDKRKWIDRGFRDLEHNDCDPSPLHYWSMRTPTPHPVGTASLLEYVYTNNPSFSRSMYEQYMPKFVTHGAKISRCKTTSTLVTCYSCYFFITSLLYISKSTRNILVKALWVVYGAPTYVEHVQL